MSELEDCAIAVDATYYLQVLLDNSPSHEPLLPALGGLTGIQAHIEADLDSWTASKVTPFFIFDGQTVTGQDEVAVIRGREAIKKTNEAWELYFTGQAENAVAAFGANGGMNCVRCMEFIVPWLTFEKAPTAHRVCIRCFRPCSRRGTYISWFPLTMPPHR